MKPTLESIEQRNSKRLNASILDPVKVESVDDIRRVLDELDPAKNKSQRNVNVATTMLSNDDGKNEASVHLPKKGFRGFLPS